jgi:hypothetical protein
MPGELCIQGRSPMPDDLFSRSSIAICVRDLGAVQPFQSGIKVPKFDHDAKIRE